jgi:enoyl-CoA hydratase/carnithine racemase
MDMQRLREIAEEGGSYELQRRSQTLLRSVPKPVIAAVNGACAGVGFVQALMADIRYTAHDAKWTAPFAKLGLVAEDAIAWRLQRVAGEETAADLLLSGRVIDGDEAVSMRIASRAYPRDQVLQEALSYARHFATRSPTAMAYIKRQLLLDAESGAESARQRALQYLAEARSYGDYAEGVRAYRDARPPHFDGLLDGQYLELPKREDA